VSLRREWNTGDSTCLVTETDPIRLTSRAAAYELFVSRVSRRYEKLYSPHMGVQYNKNSNETKSKTKNTIAMQYSYKRTLMYMLCQMLTFFVAAVTYLNLCFV